MSHDMTIQAIAEKLGISSSTVSASLSGSINSIIRSLLADTDYDIFQICIALMTILGISEKELLRRLDNKHTLLLRRVGREYGGDMTSPPVSDSIASLFTDEDFQKNEHP